MDIIDRQLLGKDLCGNECVDNKSIIHPETCADQVLTECNGSKTLTEWIDEDPDQEVHHGSFSTYNNLISWLNANYPTSTYTLPVATYSNVSSPKIGGVIINPSHLTISQSGVLDIDTESLNIPSEVETTTYETEGKVALGNDTQLPINLANSTIHDTSSTVNVYPLRLDEYNHAGIAVPKADLQIQSDWNQSNDSSVDYIKNKPTIPTVNNSIVTVQQGGVTKSTFTLNQSSNVTVSLDDTDVPVASNSTIGGIKIGYTKEDNKKPVQLDENNKAFVDTEPHPIVGGMITNGLSAHFFRVGTGMESGSFTAGKWIPILTSDTMTTSNIGKCSVCFEIFMRENSKTGYAKYYLNHMSGGSLVTNKILCLSFYSEDPDIFDYDDIRCAKYVDSEDNEKVKLTIYKKVRNVAHSMFVVNILSENSDTYSNQHYFYTGTSSISETGYQLLNNDLRIGTYSTDTQKMTACLTNESGDTPIEMNTIGADNATSYTTI